MRRLRALATLLALFAFGGPIESADAGVKVRYFKGQPTYISTMPSSAVEVAVPEQRKGKRVMVAVVALNFGAEPTSLGYENIDIRTASGEEAKLVTYDELRHQAKVRAGWMTVFAGVAAGLNSYGAARYGGSGYVGRVPYYSPVGAQMALDRADAQNAALFTSIAVNLDETLGKLDGAVLRTTTIDPRTSFGGYVAFDLPKGATVADMVAVVSFAGDTHIIPLNNTAGRLQQATALDLTGGGTNNPEQTGPGPAAARVNASASPLRPPPPAPAQTSTRATQPPPAPKCGMIQVDDGVILVPCGPARSALRDSRRCCGRVPAQSRWPPYTLSEPPEHPLSSKASASGTRIVYLGGNTLSEVAGSVRRWEIR